MLEKNVFRGGNLAWVHCVMGEHSSVGTVGSFVVRITSRSILFLPLRAWDRTRDLPWNRDGSERDRWTDVEAVLV